jgi:hypothetical protein
MRIRTAILLLLVLGATACTESTTTSTTPTRPAWVRQYLDSIHSNPQAPTTGLTTSAASSMFNSLETPSEMISRELRAAAPVGQLWIVVPITIDTYTQNWCTQSYLAANEALLQRIPGASLSASAPIAELVANLYNYSGCGRYGRAPLAEAIDVTSNRFNDFMLANQSREGEASPAPITPDTEPSVIYQAACAGFDAFLGWAKEEMAPESRGGGLILTILFASATTTCLAWLPRLFA